LCSLYKQFFQYINNFYPANLLDSFEGRFKSKGKHGFSKAVKNWGLDLFYAIDI
jgi:hypothetical protein